MRRILWVVILVLFCALPVAANRQPTTTFRGTYWGMTPEQVKKTELTRGSQLLSEGYGLMYKATLNGLSCTVMYSFTDDKLVSANYYITQPHMNLNTYISDYYEFKKLLVRKYGRPSEDKVIWSSNRFRAYRPEWGLAVFASDAAFSSTWETLSTTVNLRLSDFAGMSTSEGLGVVSIRYEGRPEAFGTALDQL